MRVTSSLSIALALLVAACSAPALTDTDGAIPHDAGPGARDAMRELDARAALDGGGTALDGGGTALDGGAPPDGGVSRLDGGDATRDAASPVDAARTTDAGPSSSRQTLREIGYQSAPNGFYEYLPPGYDGTTSMPLMIFWHGRDEDGNGTAAQLPRVLRNGPPMLIDADRWPADRPFIVLSPQNGGTGCPSAGTVRTFLRWAFDHYAVDRARVYLTGLSCGAIGGWAYIRSFLTDDEITAAVLIAGNGRGAWTSHGCDLGRIGIWAFHGTSDETINPDDDMFNMMGFPTDDRPDHNRAASELAYSDWMAAGMPMDDGLLACPAAGRRDAQLTLYPGVGHNSWQRTYDGSAGHDIYAWMLSMSR